MGITQTTTAVTRQEAVQKILVIREEIDVKERQIAELQTKKRDKWSYIKDFAKVDAIAADKGYDYMASLTRQIVKLEKSIAADKRKIKKIEDKENGHD
jgi:DNA-directed RNA polymerase subunit F